jgi:hypothetical protein
VIEATYGRLDEVLRSLGFSVRISETRQARVYEHENTGAMIVLPERPLEEKAIPHHVAAVRMLLDGYGIANESELASALQKAS